MLSKNWLLSCFLYHDMTFVSGHFKRLVLPTIYKKMDASALCSAASILGLRG